MKIGTGAIVLTGTALFLQCLYAGPAGAYDPNKDPNVVRPGTERSSSSSTQVASLIGEFERLQPESGRPSRDRQPYDPPQPSLYADGYSQPTPAQPLPYGVGADSYYYSWDGNSRWAPGRLHSSPRIPWWSLLRFTKH